MDGSKRPRNIHADDVASKLNARTVVWLLTQHLHSPGFKSQKYNTTQQKQEKVCGHYP